MTEHRLSVPSEDRNNRLHVACRWKQREDVEHQRVTILVLVLWLRLSVLQCVQKKKQSILLSCITSSQTKVESLFSPLGKLAGRAIYFTCVNFFLFFN